MTDVGRWGGDDDSAQGPSDTSLLERWRSGDKESAQQLFGRYYAPVRRFFEARAGTVAEDLTQRTFLACVEGQDAGRLRSSVRAYLFGTARRLLVLHLRQGYQRRNAEPIARTSDGGEHRTSLTGVLAKCQEQHFVLRAFAELPSDLQITVQLYYWEGLPTAEIAEITEVTPSAVTTRLARARDHMRHTVEELRLPRSLTSSVVTNLEGWTRSLVSSSSPKS